VTRVPVPAKINLALLVGERRADGLHEVATVLQRIDICDRLELVKAPALRVDGFPADTLVRAALTRLAEAAGVDPRWRVRIHKRIPVAAGLGGGSADAAAALRLANGTLADPLPHERLAEVGSTIGADVAFFLEPGPKLAEGAGETLTALDLPQDFSVVVALPRRARKASTREVYERYDGASGFAQRKAALLDALDRCRRPRDFAAFPANDLVVAAGRPPLVDELVASGAFRADVSGAGPAVYALFDHRAAARAAARAVLPEAQVWVTAPVW
jgi:4-diphosphocytidyl-2-C-methyl-D-erythritol kinase